MNELIWKYSGDISEIKIEYTDVDYADIIEAENLQGDNKSLKLEVGIENSYFNIKADNIEVLRQHCKNPKEIQKNSQLYADPDRIESTSCFACTNYIQNIKQSVLLTMWGDSVGLNLLCEKCSNRLYADLLEVPEGKIIARKI